VRKRDDDSMSAAGSYTSSSSASAAGSDKRPESVATRDADVASVQSMRRASTARTPSRAGSSREVVRVTGSGKEEAPAAPRAGLVAGIYAGPLQEGIAQGEGRLTWSDGSYYQGQFVKGLREGQGEYLSVSRVGRRTYKGGWAQSEKSGRGVEVWPNGDTYIGEYRHDNFHGQGVLSTRRGRYEGAFARGLKKGHGRMEWRNGDTYEGQWSDNLMHGTGRYFRFKDSCQYVGEWVLGQRCGVGVETRASGERYDGGWKDNKRHGVGTVRYANGRWRKGEFDSDKKKRWLTEERIG
jgi:hypothetical protein